MNLEQSKSVFQIFKNPNFKLKIVIGLVAAILVIVFLSFWIFNQRDESYLNLAQPEKFLLPEPSRTSETSIEETLLKRRSIREYQDKPLTLKEISQILWAAQGITEPQFGGRTAPSAGALYPLEVYLAVRRAENLEAGIYHYLPKNHQLEMILKNDVSAKLAAAALDQVFIMKAPVILIITGIYERTTKKYGERGIRYVHLEAGHAAQNIYLQAQSLNLGTVTIGAFDDETVGRILNLSAEVSPLYLMPIGWPR